MNIEPALMYDPLRAVVLIRTCSPKTPAGI